MANVIIGLNSEYYGISTYDVFVSTCDPTNWQIVANDIAFSGFPVNVNLNDYSITGSCYQYYVSGDTGCYCSATGSTTPQPSPSVTPSISVTPSVTPSITPTNTVTPSVTPTPSPSNLPEALLLTQCDDNLWDGYMPTDGANQYNSLSDVFLCDQVNCNDFSPIGRLFQCDIYTPYSGLSTNIDNVEMTPIYDSGGTQYTTTTFYTSVNDSCFSGSSFSVGTTLYGIVTGDSNNYVYEVLSGASYNMFMKLYSIMDYSYSATPSTDTSVILGYDVQHNGSDWVIDGQTSPDLTLRCGVNYHFHICSTGETFYMANNYNDESTENPNGPDVLDGTDGVNNNGVSSGTITVNFSSSGVTGGYWYGTGDDLGS